jgi:hypothetical protein
MRFLAVLALLLVMVLMVIRRKAGRPVLATAAGGLALLAIGLAAVSLFAHHTKGAFPPEHRKFVTGGERLGQDVVAFLPDGGRVLLIQYTPGFVLVEHPVNESVLYGLQRALRGSDVELVGFQDVPPEVEQLWWTMSMGTGAQLTQEILTAYLEAYPDVAAIISFMGLPLCPPDELPPVPPFFVWGPRESAADKAWLSSGHVKTLLVPRPGDTKDVSDDSFDARYEVLVGGRDSPAE